MSGTTRQAPGRLGEMRSLGQTGIQVSAVGQGTWAMGAKWGPQDDQASLRTLHHALDLGCRFIDTAQEYGEQVPVGIKVSPIDRPWRIQALEQTAFRHFIWTNFSPVTDA